MNYNCYSNLCDFYWNYSWQLACNILFVKIVINACIALKKKTVCEMCFIIKSVIVSILDLEIGVSRFVKMWVFEGWIEKVCQLHSSMPLASILFFFLFLQRNQCATSGIKMLWWAFCFRYLCSIFSHVSVTNYATMDSEGQPSFLICTVH